MRVVTMVGALALAVAGTAVSVPAEARPAPVDVSLGVSTPTVLPYLDGDRDRAVLRVRLDRPARLKLFVADASGRVVRKKYYGTERPGLSLLKWDAARASGGALPTGTYRVWVRAYKSGYSSVRSRTRSVRIQQQRLKRRSTTVTVRGDGASTLQGYAQRNRDRGSTIIGAPGLPNDDGSASWRAALPARTGPAQVRLRMDLTNLGSEGIYLYRLRGADGRPVEEARRFPGMPPRDGREVVAGAWRDVSSLRSSDDFTWSLVAPYPQQVEAYWSYLDVRYLVLVAA